MLTHLWASLWAEVDAAENPEAAAVAGETASLDAEARQR